MPRFTVIAFVILVEQTSNIFYFVLLQSESNNTFLIAQLAV